MNIELNPGIIPSYQVDNYFPQQSRTEKANSVDNQIRFTMKNEI